MKKFVFVILAVLFFSSTANTQTVYTNRSSVMNMIAGLDLTADRSTNWRYTGTQATFCLYISLTDANSSVTSVDMTCEASNSSATVIGAGFILPVYTSTSAAGVTSSMTSTLRQTSTAGGAPGTSKWTWCVNAAPDMYVNCTFHGNGAPAAADVITVTGKTSTP